MESRKQREKEFHNQAFSAGVRKKLDKYYESMSSSRTFYETYLKSNCRGKNVLEYGCGPGSSAYLLARHGAKVLGIDISDAAIELAKARAKEEQVEGHVSFRVMDAEKLEITDNSFDLICGTGILHHLNVNQAYAELARTLKPEGSAIFLEALGHNPMINLYRKLTPRLRTKDEHPLLMQDLKLASSFFGKVTPHYFHLFSLAAVPLRRLMVFPSLYRFFDAVDGGLFKYLPVTRRLAWIVVVVLSQPKK
jgi:ubiquinone/menaquinone biosynthesis C-methylase UbiE